MKIKEIYGNIGLSNSKELKILTLVLLQIYSRHFESAAINGTCFHDPIGFIRFSISPEFVPLLMNKDLLHMIFVSLREIKHYKN